MPEVDLAEATREVVADACITTAELEQVVVHSDDADLEITEATA